MKSDFWHGEMNLYLQRTELYGQPRLKDRIATLLDAIIQIEFHYKSVFPLRANLSSTGGHNIEWFKNHSLLMEKNDRNIATPHTYQEGTCKVHISNHHFRDSI